jgi:hypothetical protein
MYRSYGRTTLKDGRRARRATLHLIDRLWG